MKNFETKMTLRLYDTDFIKRLETAYRDSGERYESKNHFLTTLLRQGLDCPDRQITRPTANGECGEKLEHIKSILQDMHICNAAQIEQFIAHLAVTEKLTSSVYNMLLAITDDRRISARQVEQGFYDEMPDRLVKELQYLLSALKITMPS